MHLHRFVHIVQIANTNVTPVIVFKTYAHPWNQSKFINQYKWSSLAWYSEETVDSVNCPVVDTAASLTNHRRGQFGSVVKQIPFLKHSRLGLFPGASSCIPDMWQYCHLLLIAVITYKLLIGCWIISIVGLWNQYNWKSGFWILDW